MQAEEYDLTALKKDNAKLSWQLCQVEKALLVHQ
jgi:hypothetical protein